ncbi:CLUMA_CG017477, isoform A [Clunio marinus]|uniref:CLUMA_CG017477, isoform A n=1 Tax=Clunio marinus TaxID=568069 RepID=A0A1J1IXE8_9DIPT|nr:CLUMA_CG017477, isoform A [Clunio marinus]
MLNAIHDHLLKLNCKRDRTLWCENIGVIADEINYETKFALNGLESIEKSDVEELTFSWCRKGFDQSLEEFINVTSLQFSKSVLENLNSKIFQSLNQLEKLMLNRNSIKTVSPFPRLMNLKKLFLAYNEIEMITRETFVNLPAVILLTLEQNKIFYIDFEAFVENKHLEELNLNRNMLNWLHPEIFTHNRMLKEISLNYNLFETIPENIFSEIENLKVLRLHGNLLTTLSKDVFRQNKKLQWLELGDNRLKFINTNTFYNLSNLQLIDLSRNECMDEIFPTEMDFFHLLQLIKRNCHYLASVYFGFL